MRSVFSFQTTQCSAIVHTFIPTRTHLKVKCSDVALLLERVFTTAHVSSETVHRSSSWKTKRVTLDQSTHETSKRMTMATPKQTTNTLATNTPDKDFSSLKSFTSTSSTKVNDVQSSKTWTISPEQTSDVAAQVPVDEHEPHDSVIVALKYSILAVGTLVIVALAVLFVACKLWHRQ